MSKIFNVRVLTLFPEMFPGPLGVSLAGKALREGLWELKTYQIRDFAPDRHRTVDDTPYGGGAGMVMRPDILDAAFAEASKGLAQPKAVYFTPRGEPFNQRIAQELCGHDLILICGRFEGVDERFLTRHAPLEISLGDFILSGGEIPALALLDACVRLLPGVIGSEKSLEEETFAFKGNFTGLLEYPHYTKPPFWNGQEVPEVLLSGNHANIRAWRLEQAERLTKQKRPDLWARRKQQEPMPGKNDSGS